MKVFKNQLITLTIIGLLTCWSGFIMAAPPFFNFYGDTDDEAFQQMEYVNTPAYPGGAYYAVGSRETPGNPNSRVAVLSCLDTDGNLIWSRSYGQLTSFTSFAYDAATDNLMLCGTQGITNPTRQIMTIKVNTLGNPVCPMQVLTRPNTSRILGVKIIRTNEMAETYIIMSWWNITSSIDDLSLTKIDACGNVLWWNNYDFNGGDEQFADLAPWGNGGCVVAGNGSSTNWKGMILPVQGDGTATQAIFYDNIPGYFRSIQSTPSGNYLIGGNTGGNTVEDALLLYLDAGFGVQWAQRYATNAPEAITEAIEIGNEIFAGIYLPTGTGRSLHIAKFDLAGNNTDVQRLDLSFETSPYAVAKLGNGGFINGNDYLTVIDRRPSTTFGGTWDFAMGTIGLDLSNCETHPEALPFESIEMPTNTQNVAFVEVPYDIEAFDIHQDVFYDQTPICQNECGEMVIDSLSCNPDGTYNISFHLVNNTPYTVAASFFSGITPGGTFNPNFMNVNIPGSGGVSPIFNTVFTPNNAVNTPTSYCFTVSYFNLENNICCHFETCITLDPCDPCDEDFLNLTAYETPDTTDGCCYSVDVTNNWLPNYFTKIKTNLLTPGVDFTGETGGTGWAVSGTTTSLDWTVPGTGFIPLGLSAQALNFCFDNISNWSQTPQQVEFQWITTDLAGQDSIVCIDTLTFHCEPCVEILEEDIVCLPDGCIDYTFTIQNNTANSTGGAHNVDVVAILFQTTGLTVTPSPTSWNVTLAPGQTTTQTITICGATAGQVIDFKFLLIDGNIDVFDWCCHTEHSIIMPECDPNTDCIDPSIIDLSTICPAVFDPVCGCDDVVYTNSCVAQFYNGVTSWSSLSNCLDIVNHEPDILNLSTPLPINNSAVQLDWELSNDDALNFYILRSPDGLDWTLIGSLVGTQQGLYEYLDEEPLSLNSYYAIAAERPNGVVVFSNAEETFIDNEPPIVIYPNPANEFIQVKTRLRLNGTNYTGLQLVSATGNLIETRKVKEKQLDTPFDVSKLRPGLYFILIMQDNGTIEKLPFIIENKN